jgi:hypothetical protein
MQFFTYIRRLQTLKLKGKKINFDANFLKINETTECPKKGQFAIFA